MLSAGRALMVHTHGELKTHCMLRPTERRWQAEFLQRDFAGEPEEIAVFGYNHSFLLPSGFKNFFVFRIPQSSL